ncbi:N-acetyltransferase [Candidatus Fermentibacteria bacterium]|nr:MAG: N-acetyltransferase [Candidatus Fermentibacteria bacterium]
MPFSIEEVKSKGQLREFIDLPFRLYKDDPCWVPPVKHFQKELFDRKKHPFHEHSDVTVFLARNGEGRAAGRIVSIVNRAHNDFHDEKTGFFGFLEGEKDEELFKLLLTTAEDKLKAAGMEKVRGPMNFSTNEECGLLVKGFDSCPLIMMTYNPPWYADMLEGTDYEKLKDLFAYYLDSDVMDYSKMSRVANLVLKRTDAVIRDISVKHVHRDVPIIMDIYNECWQDNWGFVPMTQRETDMLADELKMILIAKLAPVVEVNGEPVAFAIALPDANQAFKRGGGSLIKAVLALKVPLFKTRINQVRVMLLGVRKAFRGRGLEALMIDRVIKSSIELGMGKGELSWILEDNLPMRKILEKDFHADPYRIYRIYQKNI